MKLNKEQLLSIVRHLLTAGGAILITTGVADDGIIAEISGSLITLVSAIWSVLDKSDSSIASKIAAYQAKMQNNKKIL